MIVFDLLCREGHAFEGWFASSEAFAQQQRDDLIACPQCGSGEVAKAPMAPAVPRKSNQRGEHKAPVAQQTQGPALSNAPMPPEVRQALHKLAEAQAKALKDSTWVGQQFADQARAMHYGEREQAVIHGQATPAEAEALAEEGVPVAPLLFPLAPPEELN